MQSVQQRQYFVDPQQLPPGIRMEQVERALVNTDARRQSKNEATQRALEDLQSSYLKLRRELLGPEDSQRLQEFMTKNRQPDLPEEDPSSPDKVPAQNQLAAQMERFMAVPNVSTQKLDGLKKLNSETIEEFKRIIDPPLSKLVEVTPQEVDTVQAPSVISQTRIMPAPSASALAIYRPGYGWWNRNAFSYASGSGKVRRDQSYLWPEIGRTGSCIWAQNKSASDVDILQMIRGNGFLLGYTTPQNGILRIEIDMECSLCQHRISTKDEFGWSDYDAETREVLSTGILWNWEDPDLGVELRDDNFVTGLRGSGDGEKSPGTVYPVAAGSKRTYIKYLDQVSLFSGQSVFVYVGTEQKLWAFLNDVSCNIFTNGAWYITEVRIQTL
jgi:hypothetical protein